MSTVELQNLNINNGYDEVLTVLKNIKNFDIEMMMPMEDMPSQNPDCPTPTSDENVPGADPPSAVPSSPPSLNFRRLLCCGNRNNIPRHKIEPVIVSE